MPLSMLVLDVNWLAWIRSARLAGSQVNAAAGVRFLLDVWSGANR